MDASRRSGGLVKRAGIGALLALEPMANAEENEASGGERDDRAPIGYRRPYRMDVVLGRAIEDQRRAPAARRPPHEREIMGDRIPAASAIAISAASSRRNASRLAKLVPRVLAPRRGTSPDDGRGCPG